jgi:CBS domain-containing protein
MKASDVMTRRVLTRWSQTPACFKLSVSCCKIVSMDCLLSTPTGSWSAWSRKATFCAETTTEKRRSRWLEFLIGPGRLADEYVKTHARKVDEVMTREPRTITEDTPLEEVVQIMERHKIKRLPVMQGKTLVGIVSRANFLETSMHRKP